MLSLVFLALFVFVQTEDLLGVNYSFDVDFYTNFNSKRCGNEKSWRLVTYDNLKMKPPFINSDKAIQADGRSCTSSFPIIFVGGILDIHVYTQDIPKILNLIVEVFDKDDVRISRYLRRRSRIDVGPGWHTIYLQINKHAEGYIHFRGNSLKNNILLIDSFLYTPNNTIKYHEKRSKRKYYSLEDEDELIFKNSVLYNQYESMEIESYDENVTEEVPSTTEEPVVEPKERISMWNPFTISLVSFGVVVVVLLLVVGAYHYGKVRAIDTAPLQFIDEEPPRTITIPRVSGITGRSNRSSPLTFSHY